MKQLQILAEEKLRLLAKHFCCAIASFLIIFVTCGYCGEQTIDAEKALCFHHYL